MDYDFDKKELKLDRSLSELDKFVIEFCNLLEERYVIVSGYVSILLGRSRATEDVDLLVPDLNLEEFRRIWQRIELEGFECLNTSSPEEAFQMWKEHAVRFAKIGKPIPNMEFKKIKKPEDAYSFKNSINVFMKEGKLKISPLEMQIVYKLDLGSEKDLEDAKHLYALFKEKLNNT